MAARNALLLRQCGRRPARRRWRRSPRPTGSTPPMTATPGAGGSTRPFRRCSRREVEALWVVDRHGRQQPRAGRALPAARRHHLPPRRPYPDRRMRRARILHRRRQIAARRGRGREADAGRRSTRCSRRVRDDVHQAQPRRALDHQRHRIWPASTRPTRPRRSARCAGSAGSASTSTAPASPMRWRSLGCAPADLTWRAGVDALSFGFVKNGGLSAEA